VAERVEFTTLDFASGEPVRLVGEIDWPLTPPPVPGVVFSHGWGSGKGSRRNVVIAQHLAQAGMAALRFDYTGHGESWGTPEQSTWGQQAADLARAISYMLSRPEVSRVGVAGASTGGLAAIRVTADDERIQALVLREPRAEDTDRLVPRLKAPTLIISGGAASPLLAELRRLDSLLGCPHRLLVIEGGGHLFEDPATFEIVTRQTVAWFERHLLGLPPG
jgi:pimeloyl-ACP methyl ester carboxylesterase